MRAHVHVAIEAADFKLIALCSLGLAGIVFVLYPHQWPLTLLAVLAILVVSKLCHAGWQHPARHPDDADVKSLHEAEAKSLLLVGCGNVGAGIGLAFAKKGWQVTTIDPMEALVPSELRVAPNAFLQSRLEDVEPGMLAGWVAGAYESFNNRAVVYAADCGNRDEYAADASLGPEQERRFESFVEMLFKAHRDAQIGHGQMATIYYIGGSWTRRAALGTDPPLVGDGSPAKPDAECNPYERAKTRAQATAQRLAESLELEPCITFCDWPSVVPNFAPNFTIAKMTEEALSEAATISYTGGEYGRPLCHSEDAGRALLMLCERDHLVDAHIPTDRVVLVPGHFTPFVTFAATVQSEVERRTGVRATLVESAAQPPATLKAHSRSMLFERLGFSPDEAMVEEGLRVACAARVESAKR